MPVVNRRPSQIKDEAIGDVPIILLGGESANKKPNGLSCVLAVLSYSNELGSKDSSLYAVSSSIFLRVAETFSMSVRPIGIEINVGITSLIYSYSEIHILIFFVPTISRLQIGRFYYVERRIRDSK